MRIRDRYFGAQIVKRLCLLTALLFVASCAAEGSDSYGHGGSGPPFGGGDWDQDASGNGDDGWPDEEPTEDERIVLTSPAATANYLFLANRTRGTLVRARIAGIRISVESSVVGPAPSEVVAWPGRDGALTINAGDDSVSRLLVTGDSAKVDRSWPASPVNRWSVAPDGKYAVAWWDGQPLESGRTGAVSEVYLYDLQHDYFRGWQLSTGSWVRSIVFPEDGERLIIISEDGVSFTDLSAISNDTFLPPTGMLAQGESARDFQVREAMLLDDGDTIVVRHTSRDAVRVLSLSTMERSDIEFDAPVTDLAALPGGTDIAVTLREAAALVIVDAADPQAGQTRLELGEELGRTLVTSSGERAISFTTVGEVMEATKIALTDLSTGEVQIVDVRKGVSAGALSPDGRFAILLHRRVDLPVQAGLPEQELLARLAAWSLVDLSTGTTKLVATDYDPTLVSFDDLGEWAMVLSTLGLPGLNELSILDLQTLATSSRTFPLEPSFIGFLPGRSIAFIAEEHPLGKLTFIDLPNDDTREITGFELNAYNE